MSDEPDFENLFAEFDSAITSATPPRPPEGYPRVRKDGLWSRFVRWVVQGPGLLLALFLLFVVPLVKEPEIGMNLPGVFVILWLVSPLLGQRPLTQPFRWLVLGLPSVFLLLLSSTLVRCAIDDIETRREPFAYFTRSLLELTQKATEPFTLGWQMVIAAILFALTRRLARKLPWVEPTRRPSRFRQVVGYTALGMLLGLLGALPMAYQFAWSQPWLDSPAPNYGVAYSQWKPSLPDDLGSLYPEVLEADVRVVADMASPRRQALLHDATERLSSDSTLTRNDWRVVAALLNWAEKEATSSHQLSEFVWSVFTRSAQGTLPANAGSKAFERHVLPIIAASAEPEMWRARLDALPPAPAALETFDAVMAEAVREAQRPFPYYTDRPVRVLGLRLPLNASRLADEAKLTLRILVYQERRKELTADLAFLREPEPYIWPLSSVWNEVCLALQDGSDRLAGSSNGVHLQDRALARAALAQALQGQGAKP